MPISALEHFDYCPRQCSLIHVEQTFDDNVFTVRGSLNHEHTDTGHTTTVDGVRQMRSVPLWSFQHGLIGKADVVEFHPQGPIPVEHKSGRLGRPAAMQLCAQAICLEEMLDQEISEGMLYSHATKRRQPVPLDAELRDRTLTAAAKVRQMIANQELPAPVNDARCPTCSLVNACLPTIVAKPARIRGYQGALYEPAIEKHSGWL